VWNIQGDNIVLIAIVMGIVINAFLFYFAARLVHIPVDFWRAALGWLAFSIVSAALSQIAIHE
jgi:uncharacterized membrane protein YjjP (DUF1212 family)